MDFQSDSEHGEFLSSVSQPQSSGETAPQPTRELWRIRDLLIFIVVGVVSLVAAGPIAIVGYYAVVAPAVGRAVPFQELRTNVIFGLSVQLVWYAFLLAYIYLFITLYYKQPFLSAMKWKTLSVHNAIRYLLGGAALSLIVMIIPPLLPEKKGFPLEKLFNSPASAYAIAAFAVLIAPFMEELLFRGLLFAFFEKRAGLTFAIVATAVLFSGLHIPEYWGAWNHLIMILVVGLTFSLARGLTGSLTPSFVLHLAYNGTMMLLLFIQTHHFHQMPPGFLSLW
ncbi:MAG TPA: type II CAAX endopeptidase family protein [Terriglobia bacterium]|jgi:membrane protease YdiL (CAAX protease family)|nr:type II CAAX endopeptidase family protein [Terriglobia bacterium]